MRCAFSAVLVVFCLADDDVGLTAKAVLWARGTVITYATRLNATERSQLDPRRRAHLEKTTWQRGRRIRRCSRKVPGSPVSFDLPPPAEPHKGGVCVCCWPDAPPETRVGTKNTRLSRRREKIHSASKNTIPAQLRRTQAAARRSAVRQLGALQTAGFRLSNARQNISTTHLAKIRTYTWHIDRSSK